MDKRELEERTKKFSIDVMKLVGSFPRNKAADIVGYQLLKSATSIGANYREATRAESRADFIHKIGIIEKEANETLYWIELAGEAALVSTDSISPILGECNQLLAIFSASGKTAKKKR
jgi:four helix bundle protein